MKKILLALLLSSLALASCKQKESDVVDATQTLTVSPTALSIEEGKEETITITPKGFNTGATASSSDVTKATVTIAGNKVTVKALKEGSVDITMTTPDKKNKAVVKTTITAVVPPEEPE